MNEKLAYSQQLSKSMTCMLGICTNICCCKIFLHSWNISDLYYKNIYIVVKLGVNYQKY